MHKIVPPVSPTKIVLNILLTIFLVEACLMFIFHLLEFENGPVMVLVDSISLSLLLIPSLYLFAYRPLAESNRELQTALTEIKTLKGIIPICCYCKKIRDDEEIWQQLEDYLSKNSDARFSHGMCPDCYEEQIAEVRKMKRETANQTDPKVGLAP